MSCRSERSGVAVIAVTRQGTVLGGEIAATLRAAYADLPDGRDVTLHVKPEWLPTVPSGAVPAVPFEGPLKARVAELFPVVETLVFVLAIGATVRLVTPLLGSKRSDPAVICVDDAGRFVIPVLGGHQVDANGTAELIADAIGATAVVTTASEAAGLPNLDRLGEGERWTVEASPEKLKQVCAALLEGDLPTIYFQFDRPTFGGDIPPHWPRVVTLEALRGLSGSRIAVTDRLIDPTIEDDGGPLLVYRPQSLTLGVGCSTDATPEEVEALVRATLEDAGLAFGSIRWVATIDRRVDHPAIVHLAERFRAQGTSGFSAEELAAVANLPTPSEIVRQAVGTPGVCEPAAILGTFGGTLIVPKRKSARATVAVGRSAPRSGRASKLSLVGIGPGPLDLMTPRARRAIRDANTVIGYRAYLDQVSPLVAANRLQPYELGQERERAADAIRLAREGYDVALVSSGDIGVYGMAGLVYELLAEVPSAEGEPPLDVEIVPGVTAASSAGALLGAPLMLDFAAISLSDLLVPWESVRQRLTGAAEGDLVVVLYNPASARRRRPFEEALAILRRHRSPETPVGLVREAYRPDQRVLVTTLGALPAEQVDMRTVVVIGCSRTAVLDGRIVTRRGYLPKRAQS